MGTLSKNQEKLIRSLQQKKFREEHQLFVVEGEKIVEEALLSDFKVLHVVFSKHIEIPQDNSVEFLQCDVQTMKRISSLKTAPGVLAVVAFGVSKSLDDNGLILALDRIQDPGNFGTIIRSADAFGLKQIVCSQSNVDCYSPKVVQASMGSIFRLKITYVDLDLFIREQKEVGRKVYAAHLKGKSVYHQNLEQSAVLIMGNESKGISDELLPLVDALIKIPIPGNAESLNVAMATAITLSEFSK